MRIHAVPCLALAFLALVPLASSVCVPSCEVVSVGRQGAMLAFAPPVLAIGSGETVTWSSSEGGSHVAASGLNGDRSSFCFVAPFSRSGTAHVTFFVEEGWLFALSEGEARRCDEAQPLPGGGFALPYYCPAHPGLQMLPATLIVQP